MGRSPKRSTRPILRGRLINEHRRPAGNPHPATRMPVLSVAFSERHLVDKCRWTHYTLLVIRSFQHRGLKRLYERGDRSLIRSDLHDRVEVMLAQLDVASSPEAMRLPHYRLHALKGKLKGYWSVTVKANWRIIFRFEGEDVYDVELIDYH